jgi:hypothetical protein
MPTLGTDCDIILQHADVNGGVGYGFLLVRYADKNQTVKVERAAWLDLTSAYVDQVKVSCRLYLRDGAKGPDGQVRSETRAVEYARLLSLLEQRTGLALQAQIGTFAQLHATLACTEEFHHQSHSEIVLMLNNGNFDELQPGVTAFTAGQWWFDNFLHSGQYLTVGF